MESKDKGKEGQITYYFPGKRGERSSDSSSPGSEKPPAKSVKFTEDNMLEQEDIRKVLNTIQDNTNKLLEENKALRNQYSELQKSLEFHIAKIETITTENEALKKEMKSMKKRLNEATEERDEMYEDLGTAINQLDDLEQYTRKHNLEIHGIPETPDENIAERVTALGNVLNVTIRTDDIDICHRLQTSKNPSKPKPIIVRFKSYRAKKELYGARKQLKGQNLNQVFNGGGIVYINENLTRMRRELFAKVWKRKKSEHWHSAWTTDGKIFVKIEATDYPIRIYNNEDLDRIY
ncbi:uncharacterized protein LOC144642060 [Oculina patagonica]